METSDFVLRLPTSLLDEDRKPDEPEGVAINQLINVTGAEKHSAFRTEDYFPARATADVRRSTFSKGSVKALRRPPAESRHNSGRDRDFEQRALDIARQRSILAS